MKKTMITLTGIFTTGCIASTIAYIKMQKGVMLLLAITFGTFAYHFLMRLLVGSIIDGLYHNNMDYRKKWFQAKSWETRLYKKLKVKKWKDRMPTYDIDTFSFELHSMEEIIMAMCQSEIVHEIIVVFSLVPLTFSIWFGSFGVFFITSILAAGFDMMFVIMQRYNRPRLVKILKKSNKD